MEGSKGKIHMQLTSNMPNLYTAKVIVARP